MKNCGVPGFIKSIRYRDKGLTAIELAVVMAVLAILAAIVAGSVTGMNQSARSAAETTDKAEVQKAIDQWAGEHPASRYPVSTPMVVDDDNAVIASATPAANGLPQVGSGLYVRLAFTDSFTNPEGKSKTFVPGFMARIPKYGRDDPNPWVVGEDGTAKLLAPALPSATGTATSIPTITPTPTSTSTPTATPTATPTPTVGQTQLVWASRANMLTARDSMGVAVPSNGKIYAIGGINWNADPLGRTNIVEEYDAATNTWTTKPSMPTPRWAPGAAAVNGKIYAIGGSTSNASSNYAGYPVATVEEYDVLANTWTTKASMTTARDIPGGVVASNGKIYAIGGASYGTSLATVEEYDPSTNTWTTKANMPTARDWAGVAVASNGNIYVIGGKNSSGYLATVEEYDPAANTWTARASMPAPRTDLGAVAASNGKIYAIGGYRNGYLTTVEEYDPVANTWTTMASLPTARNNLGVALAGNGKIYAIGGTQGGVNGVPTNEEATIQ